MSVCRSRPNTSTRWSTPSRRRTGSIAATTPARRGDWSTIRTERRGTTARCICDPTDPEHVVTLNAQVARVARRRQDVQPFAAGNGIHSDHHALWINPDNTGADDPRQRRRAVYVVGRRAHLGPQREHRRRTVLRDRGRRRAAVLQRVRRPAGQSDVGRSESHAQQLRPDATPTGSAWRAATASTPCPIRSISRSSTPNRRRAASFATTRAPARRRTSARCRSPASATATTGARRFFRRSTTRRRSTWRRNYLFKSIDRGDSWDEISPDLTRGIDRNKLPLRGAVARLGVSSLGRNEGTAEFSNITTIDESPFRVGIARRRHRRRH